MRFLANLLWIVAFLVATYSWMVAFEHGFAWDGFREGFKTEWRQVTDVILATSSAESAPASTPSPEKP